MKKLLSTTCFLFLFLIPVLAKGEASSWSEAIKKARPACVFIVREVDHFENAYGQEPPFYATCFRSLYQWWWPNEHGHGSGFLISPNGYIVTNEHVVDGATHFIVALHEQEKRLYRAHLVGSDPRSDIAVLKIECDDQEHFPYLTFGNAQALNVGDPVVSIGNPRYVELEATATKGIISGIFRNDINYDGIEGLLQTDASISSGCSGCPLLNKKGEVIGVINSGYSNRGLNFAIPSNIAQSIVAQILDTKGVRQGYLGIKLPNDYEWAFHKYAFFGNEGACIGTVLPSSPASLAGLKDGDVIIAVDDYPIYTPQDLRNIIWSTPPETEVQVRLIRDGEELILTICLAEKNLQQLDQILTELAIRLTI